MIKKASELLFVSQSDAAALLIKFRWKIQKLETSYFEVWFCCLALSV